MTLLRVPLLSLVGIAVVILPSKSAGESADTLDVLRWEKEFLLVHRNAPLEIRAKLFRSFQKRILGTRTPSQNQNTIFELYEEVRKEFDLQALEENRQEQEEGVRRVASELKFLHADVRKHLRQKSGEEVIAELSRSFAADRDPRRTLQGAVERLLALGDGSFSPGLEPQAREDLYFVLRRWVASWDADVTPEQLAEDLDFLERCLRVVPPAGGSSEPGPLSPVLLDFAARVASACADDSQPIEKRLPLVSRLNPCLDILRASKLRPGVEELDRRLRLELSYGSRFVPPAELQMDFLQRVTPDERGDIVDVGLAVLAAIQFLDVEEDVPGGRGRRLEVELEPGDHRPFYFPPGTVLGLEYDLYPAVESESASASPPQRIVVVLSNLSRMNAGMEVKPPLPRAFLTDHVYVYDDLRTLNLGYWVKHSCWSRREMLERLRAYVHLQPLPRQRRALVEKLVWLWKISNLSAVTDTPEEALAGGVSEPGTELLDEDFLLHAFPEGPEAKALARLFAADDGVLHRRAGEELPGHQIAELLVHSGTVYGFELGQATALLEARQRPLPSPANALASSPAALPHLATGVCPVIPVKLIEANQ